MSVPVKNGDNAAPQGYSTELKSQTPDNPRELVAKEQNKASSDKEKKELPKIEEESDGEYDEGEVNNIIELLNKLEKKPKKLQRKEESESSSDSEDESPAKVKKNKRRDEAEMLNSDLYHQNLPVRNKQYNPDVQAYMQKSNIRQKNFR